MHFMHPDWLVHAYTFTGTLQTFVCHAAMQSKMQYVTIWPYLFFAWKDTLKDCLSDEKIGFSKTFLKSRFLEKKTVWQIKNAVCAKCINYKVKISMSFQRYFDKDYN